MNLSMKVRAGLILTILLLGCGSSDEKPEPKQKAEEIPLKSIYVTFTQKGTNFVELDEGKIGKFFHVISAKEHSGASNLFLVRGKDIKEAMSATAKVLSRGASADLPATPEGDTKSKSIWAVVYLGIDASGPPVWLIHSVEKQANVIRVSVSKPRRYYSTKDSIGYFAWIPVGELEPGRYAVELFEVDAKFVSLRRRVALPRK